MRLPTLLRGRSLRNIGWLYGLQVANYLIPLLTLPYLVRTLGTESYGVLAFAYSVNYFLVLLVDAGFNPAGIRALAALRNLPPAEQLAQARDVFWGSQVIKVLLASLCFVVLLLATWLIPHLAHDRYTVLVSFLIVMGTISFPVWALQGLEKMRDQALYAVAGRLLATVGIFITVRSSNDTALAAFWQSSATLFSGLMLTPALLRMGLHWHWPGWKAIHLRFLNGVAYMTSDFMVSAMNNAPVFLLGWLHSKEIVGIYAAIDKLARTMVSAFAPVRNVLLPKIAAAAATDQAKAQSLAKSTLRLLVISALVGTAFAAVIAPWLLALLFGSHFSPYANVFRVLCLWAFVAVGVQVAQEFCLLAFHRQSELIKVQRVASAFMIIALPALAAFTPAQMVMTAVSLGMVCTELISSSLLLRFGLFQARPITPSNEVAS